MAGLKVPTQISDLLLEEGVSEVVFPHGIHQINHSLLPSWRRIRIRSFMFLFLQYISNSFPFAVGPQHFQFVVLTFCLHAPCVFTKVLAFVRSLLHPQGTPIGGHLDNLLLEVIVGTSPDQQCSMDSLDFEKVWMDCEPLEICVEADSSLAVSGSHPRYSSSQSFSSTRETSNSLYSPQNTFLGAH